MTITPNHIQTMDNLKDWLNTNIEKMIHLVGEDKYKIKIECFCITDKLDSPLFSLKKWMKESEDGKWRHTFHINDQEINSSHGYELWEYIEKLLTRKEELIKEEKLQNALAESLDMIHKITQQVIKEDLEK